MVPALAYDTLDVAFGGAKESGVGRQQGIEEFTQLRVVNACMA